MRQDTAAAALPGALPTPRRARGRASATPPDAVWSHGAMERHRDTVFRTAFSYLIGNA